MCIGQLLPSCLLNLEDFPWLRLSQRWPRELLQRPSLRRRATSWQPPFEMELRYVKHGTKDAAPTRRPGIARMVNIVARIA